MHRRSFLFSFLAFPVLNWWIDPPQPEVIQLAATGNLREVLSEVARYVETRNPFTKVKLFFGSSEEIARQIGSLATFDLCVGDEEDLAFLASKSLLVPGTLVPLFMNQVVAIAGADVEWEITEAQQLTPDTVKKIALLKENTKGGKLARDYLKKYGVLDALKDKITDAKSPKAAIDAVRRGDAKWTFAYSTDAARRKSLKVLWRVPPSDLPARIYSAGRLTCSKNPDLADRAIAGLQSSIVRKMFENAGFQLLTPPQDNRKG